MRRLYPALLAGALAALAACSDAGPVAPAAPETAPLLAASGRAVPGSYIVVLGEGASPRAVASLTGVEPLHVYTAALNGFAAKLSPGQLTALRHHPAVAYVEQDQEVELSSTPWNLDRIDQRTRPLDGMFQVSGTGAGVNVYLIDTGVEVTHPAFGGRASNVFNASGGPLVPCGGHGTHVAGIAGSTPYGVAKGAGLRGVIVTNCLTNPRLADLIAGMDWVRLNHVKPAVVNVGLNGAASASVDNAVNNLYNAGLFTSVAAGNDNSNACSYSPARAAVAYTVGASTSTDARASFSNYGSCLDIFAPGQGILSTWTGGGTSTLSGTSMASAHVAGAAALFLGLSPGATPSAVTSWITTNATTGVLTGIPPGTPNRLLYIP
jgi:subtilisin family serine protease